MPVEIRELVLQARVVDADGASVEPQGQIEDSARLRAEILASCAQLIRDELQRDRAR